jgi:hypothetical protein
VVATQSREGDVPSIVEYTDQKHPMNEYPVRIVSPVHSGPCCFSAMEEVGGLQQEERWVFGYKRCKKCGFTVRVIVRELVDERLQANLRETLKTSFARS